MDTAQTALFYRISQYRFICVELNIYLDTHPDDANARADYLCYARRLNQLIVQYEAEYGPLLNFGQSPTETGCYVMSQWPWE